MTAVTAPLSAPPLPGAIASTLVPGWHLTMIASPGPVAAAIDSLG